MGANIPGRIRQGASAPADFPDASMPRCNHPLPPFPPEPLIFLGFAGLNSPAPRQMATSPDVTTPCRLFPGTLDFPWVCGFEQPRATADGYIARCNHPLPSFPPQPLLFLGFAGLNGPAPRQMATSPDVTTPCRLFPGTLDFPWVRGFHQPFTGKEALPGFPIRHIPVP